MIQKPCVNGILAAVLSASVIPLHGALAKEKSHRLRQAMAKSAPKSEAAAQAATAAGRPAPAQ